MNHKFEFGAVVATPTSLDLLHQYGINPLRLLSRHVTGDWGDVCSDDAAANDDRGDPMNVAGRELDAEAARPPAPTVAQAEVCAEFRKVRPVLCGTSGEVGRP